MFNPATYIHVPVPSNESDRSYMCVLGVSIEPLSMILRLHSKTMIEQHQNHLKGDEHIGSRGVHICSFAPLLSDTIRITPVNNPLTRTQERKLFVTQRFRYG